MHFPLRICNSIPSLPESLAGPEDLCLPLARGDGVSRADSLQLGPAWHREGAPGPHTKRAAVRFPVGKFCLWPMAHLVPPAVRQPMFSRFLGMTVRQSAQNQGGWTGSLLLPTCPLPFWSLRSTSSLWPCQLLVTLCGPVTPFCAWSQAWVQLLALPLTDLVPMGESLVLLEP